MSSTTATGQLGAGATSTALRRRMLTAFVLAAHFITLEQSIAAESSTKVIHAKRLHGVVSVDGALTEQAWSAAEYVDDFTQREPDENAPPSSKTAVALVYDNSALYVGIRMEVAPGGAQAVMTRRDVVGSAEWIVISLDTYGSGRTARSFAVSVAGVRADWVHRSDDAQDRDYSFDPVWEAESVVEDDQWTVEMRIPLSQLRFRASEPSGWRVNVNRVSPQNNEDAYWAPVPRDSPAWVSHFGDVTLSDPLHVPARVEIMPYLALELERPGGEASLEPAAKTGVDAKIGLGANLTLDLAVNPDFGQVEADPAIVNLTQFEPFFEERRPFFVEGAHLLAGDAETHFYSRRIGAPPRVAATEELQDTPDATSFAAAKLTGRLDSGLSLGGLIAVTRRLHANVATDPEDETRSLAVAPRTLFGVARLEQEIGTDGTLGASATVVHRSLSDNDALAATHISDAFTGGVDYVDRFGSGDYEYSAYLGGSALAGQDEAVARIQESSTHYFQRPDQAHVSYDPTREWLGGWASTLTLRKRTGSWRWDANAGSQSPGFDLNDVGRLTSGDDIAAYGGVSYLHLVPSARLYSWSTSLRTHQEWNFGGVRDPGLVWLDGAATFPNFTTLSARIRSRLPGHDDARTRGGPVAGVGWGWDFRLKLENPKTARYYWSARVDFFLHETDRNGLDALGRLVATPTDGLRVELRPRVIWLSHDRQYVTSILSGELPGLSDRYVFGRLRRRELSVQVRTEFAWTPDLSVQLYVEPFVFSGRHDALGELPSAGSRDLRLYGTDGTSIQHTDGAYLVADGTDMFEIPDPDITVLSIRGTLVSRWEFRRGSTLFLVWQVDGTEVSRRARDVDASLLSGPFGVAASHTFLAKASYWWSL